MLRIAYSDADFVGTRNVEISDIELLREGKSYTYVTLCELSEKYPDAELFLYTGSDMFYTLESWYRGEDILKMCSVVTTARKKDESLKLSEYVDRYGKRYGTKCIIMDYEPVVSIWPFVEDKSENYPEMNEKGYLVRSEKGLHIALSQRGHSMPYDTTHPGARKFVWEKAKKSYYDRGIKTFWLDEAEPEYMVYDFENYRYYLGPNTQVGNIYPLCYAQGFYEGRKAEGETEILNLIRCAWAGSQKYGTLVWSGDVHSSFESFKQQICAGLNMAISGIPWWTTDIGGFSGGHIEDPDFHELLVRWFQYGTFCPVMRLHGNRLPFTPGTDLIGGGCCGTGAPNEVWSFGEEVYNLLKPYMFVREALKPYIKQLMTDAHTNGDPVMRPLFYEFPDVFHICIWHKCLLISLIWCV